MDNPTDSLHSKSRKRAPDDEDSVTLPKRRCQERPTLPTPSPTASLNPKTRCRPASKVSAQSEPKPLKRSYLTYQHTDLPADREADKDSNCDLAPSKKVSRHFPEPASEPPTSWSSIEAWVAQTPCTKSVQETVESGEILQTIEEPISQDLGRNSDVADDVDYMSERDGETTGPASTAGSGERLNTSSPLYRGTLAMNDVITDTFGDMIPPDVQRLITMHIRKERKSPKLEEDQKTTIKQTIKDVWDSPEPMVSDIITPPLFPVKHAEVSEGRDTLWSTTPLPRNPDYAYALPAPKTDRHFGFHPTRKSNWTAQQLSAADNSKVRPYSQPTPANMFPFFLMELKSEATGGTLYGAEGQLATSGAHRVRSLIWTLDLLEPSRKRSSADAIVFSAAVSQRETVAHVHYFNPEDNRFYMSWIDAFTYAKKDGMQECHDYVKNAIEWMVDIQQPMVKDAMDKLHPITRLWKKRGTVNSPVNATESCKSENGGLPPKRQRRDG